MTAQKSRPRIISGIQPSGALHIGNYFGMMRQAVALQEKGDCLYFVADWHALTSLENPDVLRGQSTALAAGYIASGLDLKRTILFRQSDVFGHLELMWYLSTVTPMGLMERAHSYKDKIARGIAASHSLFTYPILMAADILLYQANLVPVGKDQKQHMEIARDLAQKFNDRFGPVLTVPEAYILDDVAVVPGADGQKMSKSYGNTIELFAQEKAFVKQVMQIKTDSTPVEAPKPIKDSVLIALHQFVSTPDEHREYLGAMQAGGVGYGDLKKTLAERLLAYFAPMRERYNELMKEPGKVDAILHEGGERARAIAKPTILAARKALGLD